MARSVSRRAAVAPFRVAAAALGVMVLAACGPLRPEQPVPSPRVRAAADSAEAMEARLQRVGPHPSSDDMSPDVVLYTELTRIPGVRLDLERDTLRGVRLVSRWLQHRRGSAGVPFELRVERVYLCDEAVLQYGTYLIRGDARSARVAMARSLGPDTLDSRVPYTARWRRGAGDALRMDALWLGPQPGEVRSGRLAGGCREAAALKFAERYAERRWSAGLSSALAIQQSATGSLQDAVESHGWDRNLESGRALTAELEASFRLRPGWQVKGIASYQLPASAGATSSDGVFHATVEWSGGTVGGLLVHELGPVRLGLGPALSVLEWRWSDEVVSYVFESGQPTSGTSVVPGGVVEAGYIQTMRSRIYAFVSARYYYFGNAAAPGFRDLDPLSVPLSEARVNVGIGWWW